MKLQLALDDLTLDDALDLARRVAEYVDIFEIGTPFVIDRGMEGVRAFRETFRQSRTRGREDHGRRILRNPARHPGRR
jgi:3-keto-L-gulonate-6-phosphate decarboxylase